MFFIGHTRFSLFTPGSIAWQASKKKYMRSEEAYFAHLFSDERLEPRMRIFLEDSLPQLELAVSDRHQVRHVVSYDRRLPSQYKEQLAQAARRYPFLVLDERAGEEASVDPDDLAREMFAANSAGTEGQRVFGHYRLDDDDILATDYFDAAAELISPSAVGSYISFGLGLTAFRIGGNYTEVRQSRYPMVAIGLMAVCELRRDGSVFRPDNTSHQIMDTVAPVILDSREVRYVWTRHTQQDSALGKGDSDTAAQVNRVRELMRKYPKVTDRAVIEQKFPAIAHRFTDDPDAPRIRIVERETQLVHEPLRVQTPPLTGHLQLRLRTRDSMRKNKPAGLISFHVKDSAGQPILPDSPRSAAIDGLAMSKIPGVEFYRYIPTVGGVNEILLDLFVPEDLVVRAISLRRFTKQEGDFSATSVDIFQIG